MAVIPISGINQNTNKLSVKCAGRKVAEATFRAGHPDFTIGFTEFVAGRELANEDACVERTAMPYRDALSHLRTIPASPEFLKGVEDYPEWRLEAWQPLSASQMTWYGKSATR